MVVWTAMVMIFYKVVRKFALGKSNERGEKKDELLTAERSSSSRDAVIYYLQPFRIEIICDI
jgi:hypothetical protein